METRVSLLRDQAGLAVDGAFQEGPVDAVAGRGGQLAAGRGVRPVISAISAKA
jgi:hypothetical protein